jgi:bleomycin hydrolase
MFVDLVEKYGCVPAEAMPDTRHASETRELNDQLACVLRYFALVVRKARNEDEKHQVVWEALKVVFRLLASTLGLPPLSFKLDHDQRSLTPQQFYRTLEPDNLAEYVALVSVPQADRPFNRCFEVAGLGTMCGGRPVRYLNVELAVMKKCVTDTADSGRRVWFGSDVSKDRHEREGVLDVEAFDWPLLLGADVRLPREYRLKYRQAAVSHAMVIEGYHADPVTGQPTCFRVENTWGAAHKGGYLEMTSRWFDEFVVEVLVPPDVLSGFLLGVWHTDNAISLPPWDPLGMLLGSCCEQ